jgi:hypothetical protein
MQGEDRTIHFSAELIHPASAPKKEPLQRLYFELAQTRHAGYDNTDFTNPLQPRFYSHRAPKTQSLCIFLPDRILLVEEWADIPFGQFLDRLMEVAQRGMIAREVDRYTLHTVTVRSTFALTYYDDARVFLLDHVCHQAGKLGPYLQRPIAIGGLRFVLPETNQHPGTLHIGIETFRHSRNEIYVEAKGIFGKKQITVQELDILLENAKYVRNYISQYIYPYLAQFDQPRVEDL